MSQRYFRLDTFQQRSGFSSPLEWAAQSRSPTVLPDSSPLSSFPPRCSPNFSALLLSIFQMEGDFSLSRIGADVETGRPSPSPGGLGSSPAYFAYEAPVSVASPRSIPCLGPASEQHHGAVTQQRDLYADPPWNQMQRNNSAAGKI